MHSGEMEGIKQSTLLGVVLLGSRITTATGRGTIGADDFDLIL